MKITGSFEIKRHGHHGALPAGRDEARSCFYSLSCTCRGAVKLGYFVLTDETKPTVADISNEVNAGFVTTQAPFVETVTVYSFLLAFVWLVASRKLGFTKIEQSLIGGVPAATATVVSLSPYVTTLGLWLMRFGTAVKSILGKQAEPIDEQRREIFEVKADDIQDVDQTNGSPSEK